MTQGKLLEVARLRGLISRLRRQYGEDVTLEFLRLAIEAELAPKDKMPSK